MFLIFLHCSSPVNCEFLLFAVLHPVSPLSSLPVSRSLSVWLSLSHLFYPHTYSFPHTHKQTGQWSRCGWRSAPAKHNSVVTLLGMKQNASARKRTEHSGAESFEEQQGHLTYLLLNTVVSLSPGLFSVFFWERHSCWRSMGGKKMANYSKYFQLPFKDERNIFSHISDMDLSVGL